MLSTVPESVIRTMIDKGAKLAVVAKDEQTTDIPEYSHLGVGPDKDYYNERYRGAGGSSANPTAVCAEENVLCYQKDKYDKEDITIHEMAHSIHLLGFLYAYPQFQRRLFRLYQNAKRKNLYPNTYARTNDFEYFAEGVQSWFNVNDQKDPPDGLHNFVNTRTELKDYDPGLHNLLAEYFPSDSNKCSCH